MKYSARFLIEIYQIFFSPLLSQLIGTGPKCKYALSCSEYAKKSIEKFGIIKGVLLVFKRLTTCR